MTPKPTNIFKAQIQIIGINPFVFLPEKLIQNLLIEIKQKGKIPVRIQIDGHEFTQTLIKYKGNWRLYLNLPMRKAANKNIGDYADFEVVIDNQKKIVPTHPKLQKALDENNEAYAVFKKLPPYIQKEIKRYFANLKTEAAVDKNAIRAINFLLGKERFVGRDLRDKN